MRTRSGHQYYPTDPRASEVNITDIAHALGNLCRFGGHCNRFYSVAEHSVLVSRVVPPEFALLGLMHDATEAYVCDVPRPLKRALGKTYAAIEALNWFAIAERFGLALHLPECVHDADNEMLLAEKDALLGTVPAEWTLGIKPHLKPAKVTVLGLAPAEASALFLGRFYELHSGAQAGRRA
jgi:5'-deoxynucleotidase YfbR-like HD superfamily hydrolase